MPQIPGPNYLPCPVLSPLHQSSSAQACLTDLFYLFMPQRSSLPSPRLHSWSRWRLWHPCWTALTSKVPLHFSAWGGVWMGRTSLGSDQVCSLSLPLPWGYLPPAMGLKLPGKRAKFENTRQFGPEDTSISPAAPNLIPSAFYPTPQHLSFRVLQSPDFTTRVPAEYVHVCKFFLLRAVPGLGF